MFVSIAVDPGSEGRAKELVDLLSQYGFDKVQRGLWESAFVSPDTLNRLKKDLDRATDAFDRIRIFQFPVEGTLVLTTLRDKKWRRMTAKGFTESEPSQSALPVQNPAVPAQAGTGRPRPVVSSRAAVAGSAFAGVKPSVPGRPVPTGRSVIAGKTIPAARK